MSVSPGVAALFPQSTILLVNETCVRVRVCVCVCVSYELYMSHSEIRESFEPARSKTRPSMPAMGAEN